MTRIEELTEMILIRVKGLPGGHGKWETKQVLLVIMDARPGLSKAVEEVLVSSDVQRDTKCRKRIY